MTDNAKHVEKLRNIEGEYRPGTETRDALDAAIAALERETPDVDARIQALERHVGRLRIRADAPDPAILAHGNRLDALEAQAQPDAPAPPAETPGRPSHIDVLRAYSDDTVWWTSIQLAAAIDAVVAYYDKVGDEVTRWQTEGFHNFDAVVNAHDAMETRHD